MTIDDDSILVPVENSAAVKRLAGGRSVIIPEPPSKDELCNWTQHNRVLKASVAARAGFGVGEAKAASEKIVLVFDNRRFRDVSNEAGDVFRFGTALRAVVEIYGGKFDLSLNLPAVAAHVEVSGWKASANLQVRGYNGDLDLPNWQSFDVESYGDYVKQVDKMKNQIMKNRGLTVPELLATSVQDANDTRSTLAGELFGLRALSDGYSLSRAREAHPDKDDSFHEGIARIYAEFEVDDHPDEASTQSAAELLTFAR